MSLDLLNDILTQSDTSDGGAPEESDNSTLVLIIKIVSIFVFLGMAMAFGLMPYYITRCRESTKFLSISNSFAGGLFLGIGLLHVLPESAEKLEKYDFPWAYVCSFCSYALIFFVEKVAFDSHSLLHGHGHQHEHNMNPKISIAPLKGLDSERQTTTEEAKDEYLVSKETEKEENDENDHEKDNENEAENNDKEAPHAHNSITPYILLLALGFHGFFEGMALGIHDNVKDTLSLFFAIAAHKWAASLTLGISFIKINIPLKQLIIMILIFALIGPVGIAFGLILSEEAGDIVQGIFLGISVGTFIYIACTEVLVEEFENSDYKYLKFLMFVVGGIFTAGLALLEVLTEEEEKKE